MLTACIECDGTDVSICLLEAANIFALRASTCMSSVGWQYQRFRSYFWISRSNRRALPSSTIARRSSSSLGGPHTLLQNCQQKHNSKQFIIIHSKKAPNIHRIMTFVKKNKKILIKETIKHYSANRQCSLDFYSASWMHYCLILHRKILELSQNV